MIANGAQRGSEGSPESEPSLIGARTGPTALRMALGAQLRRLREAREVTTGQAADAIRATHSKISRLERGRRVMREQLEHLLEITELPNVTLQIVPFDAGPHAAAGGPFTILRFSEPDVPDVVYLEQLNSAIYLDQPDDVVSYMTVMNQLCVQAETGPASRATLGDLLRRD